MNFIKLNCLQSLILIISGNGFGRLYLQEFLHILINEFCLHTLLVVNQVLLLRLYDLQNK